MKAVWLSLGAAVLLTQTAVAGHLTRNQRVEQMNQMPTSQAMQGSQQGSQSLAQQMRSSLQQAGFTNLKVMPESFLIRGQDPQGNPVEMVITPNSVAAIDIGRANGNAMTGRSVAGQTTTRFVQGPVYDAMNTNLADTNVQSSDQQNVGTIKGIAIGEDGSLSYLMTIDGGRDVAVSPQAMSLSYNDITDKWNATVDATKKQIESAPQVQYNQKSQ
jgi:hypothetical protein